MVLCGHTPRNRCSTPARSTTERLRPTDDSPWAFTTMGGAATGSSSSHRHRCRPSLLTARSHSLSLDAPRGWSANWCELKTDTGTLHGIIDLPARTGAVAGGDAARRLRADRPRRQRPACPHQLPEDPRPRAGGAAESRCCGSTNAASARAARRWRRKKTCGSTPTPPT